MDMTIDQQVALDEALVSHASRLRIGKSNFRLRLDITSKESTLQLVYDIMRLTRFYKAFLVTADVLEIYMHEFWATATTFNELPFEEEIMAFLRYLGHSGKIKKLTDSSSDTTMPPPTVASTRLLTSAKGKQPAKSSKTKATKRSLQQVHISQASRSGVDEGTGIIPGVPDVPTDESDEEIS
nr:hypothetical protein [Tanacetum cinerariifolium]